MKHEYEEKFYMKKSILIFVFLIVTTANAQINLSPMWQSGDYWKPRTYDGHSSSGKYYAVDFYYNNRNRPDIYKNGDVGTAGRPILAPVGGQLFIHLLDVTKEGNGQFEPINAVKVFQGLDPIPQNCFSLVDAIGETIRVDMSLIIDFNSNTRRTNFSHLQINSSYFNSTVQQKIRDAVRDFYDGTAVGTPPRVAVSIGTNVSVGTQVGTINNWGIASEPHLHFQLFSGAGYSESSPFLGTVQDLSNSSIVTIGGQTIFLYEGTYGTGYQYPAMLRRSYGLNAPIVVNAAWDGGTGAFLRNNPGGNQIGFLPNGSTGIIIQTTPQHAKLGSNNHLWYNVQFGSNPPGWIAAEYIDLTTSPCPGDLNSDGIVNIFDLILLLQNWGQTPPANERADMNGDGTVNVFDLILLLQNWGSVCGSSLAKVEFSEQNYRTKSVSNLKYNTTNLQDVELSLTTDATDIAVGDSFYTQGSATLFLSPTSGTHQVGDTFFVEIRVDTGGEPVVVVSAVLTFDASRLRFIPFTESSFSGSAWNGSVDATQSDSTINLTRVNWVNPISPSQGVNPVSGSNLLLGTLTFEATEPGTAQIVFDQDASAIVKFDPNATENILENVVNGTYTIEGNATAVRDRISDQIPTTFALYQNYPNPFNPETKIQYDLPKSSQVKIEIFNMLGQKIRTLVDEGKAAGSYVVVWDGRKDNGEAVASGVYIYRLRTDGFVKSRKLLLLR